MLEEQFWKMVDEGRIVFGEKGDNNPAVKLFLNEVQEGLVPRTLWPHTDVGHSQEAKREIQALYPDDIPFDTPKPERLLSQVITIATNPGDFVLDSFSGSGTTGAVAHKMGRKWIMVELALPHPHPTPATKGLRRYRPRWYLQGGQLAGWRRFQILLHGPKPAEKRPLRPVDYQRRVQSHHDGRSHGQA